MAFQKFWLSVRRALRLARSTAIADTHRLDGDSITAVLRGADLWVTAKVVEDFDPANSLFLLPDDRDRLIKSVEHFRSVTSGLDPRKPVDPTVREHALAAYREIVELLEFDRFDDPDAFVLGKTIERRLVPKPPHLDHLRFRTGFDSTDDPALWVWAFVTEETEEYDEARFLERTDVIEDVLDPIAREIAPEGRLYLRFRSTLDLPERQGVPA